MAERELHAGVRPSYWRWIWPVVLAAVVFNASGHSQVASPDIVNFDKVVHALVFGLLGTLAARTQPRSRWWWGIVVASLYGAGDEWHQSFTPGRSVDFMDWIADTSGAALAVSLYALWPAWRTGLETKIWPRVQRRVDLSSGASPDSAAP